MGGISTYAEKAVLDQLFGATAYSTPATLYVALYTATPSDSGGGTEVSGGSYARVAVTNNTTNFPASTGGAPASKSNGTAITFPAPTAAWGVVTSFGVLDASTAGNLLWWGALTVSKTINNGDAAPSFAASALTFTLE